MQVVHTTDRQTFKKCRQLWDYSSVLRQNLEPLPTGPNAFWFGSGWHQALAAYYRSFGQETALREWHIWCDVAPFDCVEERRLGEAMLLHYFGATHLLDPPDDELEVLWTERTIEVPIMPGVIYTFTCDGLAKDKYGRYMIMEHKSAASIPSNTDYLLMDDQCGSYLWGLYQTLGIKAEGVIYTITRKKAPVGLEWLKSGRFSMDKRQDTTYEIAKAQLEAHYEGKVPGSYKPFLEYLEQKPDNFVYREVVVRNENEIRLIGESIMAEAKEMIRQDVSIYRSSSQYNCNPCAFYAPCLVKWEGSDDRPVLDTYYTQRKDIR